MASSLVPFSGNTLINVSELVFVCDNRAGDDELSKGICTGMVVTWIIGCASVGAGTEVASKWFSKKVVMLPDPDEPDEDRPELKLALAGRADKPWNRFYVRAEILQLIYRRKGRSKLGKTGSIAQANDQAIRELYRAGHMMAISTGEGYATVNGGTKLSEMLTFLMPRFTHFHVSLKVHPEGIGHAIGIAFDPIEQWYLFDPDRGMFKFFEFERLTEVLEREFDPGGGATLPGDYAKYKYVCVWGIKRA